MRAHKLTTALAAVPLLISAAAGAAIADNVYNNLDNTIDATAEVMSLTAGAQVGTTKLLIDPTNGDGKNGCNLTGDTELTLAVTSSNPAVATVAPGSVRFTACGDQPTLTVTPKAQGTTTVSVAQTSNNTGATFNLAPATFTVNVAAPKPTNIAPKVSVGGVQEGATYAFGEAPDATCAVVDEDTDAVAKLQLGDFTGPDAAHGVGSRTATCTYTDKGGLTGSASATYTVEDRTAPTITPVLDPATPDGEDGWYRGDVTLDWTVDEAQSPSSLQHRCAQVTVDTDQTQREYTCTATSAGGTTEKTVTIKRDGTAPTVTTKEVEGTLGANDWYTTPVTVAYHATDATSGLASDTASVTSDGEGADVTVTRPVFTDRAGNSTAAGETESFNIDLSDPAEPTFVNAPAKQVYYDQVPAAPTCTSSDDVSGLAGCVVTGGGSTLGKHTWTATATDNAGRRSTATLDYEVLPWTAKGFYAPVDMGKDMINTVKAGSTVPLKFEVFAGASELTGTSAVASFKQQETNCSAAMIADEVEILSTGATTLRYDTTGGQFIQNWQTPKKAGSCYTVKVTFKDGGSISANFKLK